MGSGVPPSVAAGVGGHQRLGGKDKKAEYSGEYDPVVVTGVGLGSVLDGDDSHETSSDGGPGTIGKYPRWVSVWVCAIKEARKWC